MLFGLLMLHGSFLCRSCVHSCSQLQHIHVCVVYVGRMGFLFISCWTALYGDTSPS
jgi:hypothetical protein